VQSGASAAAQAERGHQRSVDFDIDSRSTISSSTLSSLQSGKTILGKFAFADGDNTRLGEGTSSVCYLGSNVETGEAVAIKVYKPSKGGIRSTLAKFRRHVGVLQEVQRPFARPADDALWCEELARTDPTNFCLRLLDFSKDARGEPAQDLADGRMYIVTELADCTLKKMLRERSQRNAPLSADAVRKIAAEVLLAVAWLHSKGYVHLDVKPENIMMCGGRWKLTDMDGCVRAGTEVKLNNAVSMLPRYCAPEIVCSVVKGGSVTVKPSMDAWSVGNTIAELVKMCPLLWTQYQEISDGQSHHGGSVCFLKWLGAVQAASLPRPGESRFKILLCTWLIMPNPEGLSTLAQSLNAPYFRRQDLK
jgi:serine/threonine protein kinase